MNILKSYLNDLLDGLKNTSKKQVEEDRISLYCKMKHIESRIASIKILQEKYDLEFKTIKDATD